MNLHSMLHSESEHENASRTILHVQDRAGSGCKDLEILQDSVPPRELFIGAMAKPR